MPRTIKTLVKETVAELKPKSTAKTKEPLTHTVPQPSPSSTIMHDLEMIFRMAYEQGNFTAALKAKELQLKDKSLKINTLSLAEQLKQLSTQEMQTLIQELEPVD